jgi:basic amino acid/polyamine antiporter, APA family
VRARRAGEAIVREARRRGVEAIVLAAEESSRVRGGSLFGGVGGPLENFVGDVSRYVIAKAPCRVILTAPPADWRSKTPPLPDPKPVPADEEQQSAPAEGEPARPGAGRADG